MARTGDDPLFMHFRDLVHEALAVELRERHVDDVVDYVSRLLTEFMRTDRVYSIRGPDGRPVTSVYEMLAEGDVRLNAGSFEREREVHKHIGDYILFWSGVNPAYLSRLRLQDGRELRCDYTRQAKESYYLVSTFDYRPYDAEAATYRRLSELYEGIAHSLTHVRRHLPFGHA